MYKYLSLLQEENNIDMHTDYIDLDSNNIEYILEESYYDTLLSIQDKTYNSIKDLITQKSFILEGSTPIFNNLSLKDVSKWFTKLSKSFRIYYLKENKNIEFQMSIIERYLGTQDSYGDNAVYVRKDVYSNLFKLPFDESNVVDKLMANMDIRKEKVWLNKRDVYDDVFKRSFPKWIQEIDSITKMKQFIYDNSNLYIEEGLYNIRYLYPKAKKYTQYLKEQVNYHKQNFDSIKRELLSLNSTLKSNYMNSLKNKDSDKKYIQLIRSTYEDNYKSIITGFLTYQRAIYYIIIDMFKRIVSIIDSMYKVIPINDKYRVTKMNMSIANNIQKELMRDV